MADLTKLVACRLPQALVVEAQRHADVYRSSVSELLRQGLEYRLTCKAWPPAARDAPAAIPSHVHEVLAELARRLDQVRQELGSPLSAPLVMYNSYTSPRDATRDEARSVENEASSYEDIPLYNNCTSEDQPGTSAEKRTESTHVYDGITLAHEEPQSDFDQALFVLGKLCPRGHTYPGTTQTLLRLPSRICPQCHAARQRARRQREGKA